MSRRGGSVVAAFETSLHDETGKARADFGLADVLGANSSPASAASSRTTTSRSIGNHPVNAGFEGAARIMGGTRLMAVRARARAPTQPVPASCPTSPTCRWRRSIRARHPKGAAVVARETGAGGRAVYIPWNIGEIFWEVLAVDHARLIGNAVRWALGKPPAREVDGPGIVDLAVRENAEGVAVALFNLTNPMMMKGPVREIIPLGGQRLSVALPSGERARRRACSSPDAKRR